MQEAYTGTPFVYIYLAHTKKTLLNGSTYVVIAQRTYQSYLSSFPKRHLTNAERKKKNIGALLVKETFAMGTFSIQKKNFYRQV